MYPLIELLAVIAGATYGVLRARTHRMDFVGAFSLALMVGFGGGTLRDLFLDRHPLFWIEKDHYPVIVFGLTLVACAIPKLPLLNEKWLFIPDALGLGLFSIVGATAAIDSGTSLFVAAILGTVTGTFGGVIGDVVCNEVPNLFRTTPLYATCSFCGCWLMFGLQAIDIPDRWAVPIATVFVIAFRLIAVRKGWHLPIITGDVSPDASDGVDASDR